MHFFSVLRLSAFVTLRTSKHREGEVGGEKGEVGEEGRTEVSLCGRRHRNVENKQERERRKGYQSPLM